MKLMYFFLKYVCIVLHLTICWLFFTKSELSSDHGNNNRRLESKSLVCIQGYLDTLTRRCRPYMDCDEIDNLEIISEMPLSYTKRHFLVRQRNREYAMMYASPLSQLFHNDFLHGIKMLRQYQNTSKVVQVFGFCIKRMQIVMQYYTFGSAERLTELLLSSNLSKSEEKVIRMQLAVDYVSIIAMLHHPDGGPHVMCDSNDINKTLSQFVITNDWHLLALDLDALPRVNHQKNALIRCGHKELFGDFVAPEQLWPWQLKPFNGSLMPGYDEQTDIWKMPDIIEHLISPVDAGQHILLHMFALLKRCKSIIPHDRPSAAEVLDALTHHVLPIIQQSRNIKTKEEL